MLWRDALEYRSNRLQKDTCFMHRASSTSGLGFIYIGLGASAHIRQLSFDTHTHTLGRFLQRTPSAPARRKILSA